MKGTFVSNLFSNKKNKHALYQVLLLDNDADEGVEVQEAKQVNFFQVKKHLRKGGSVFITSKNSQKLIHPNVNAQINYSKSKKNYGVLFQQHLRGSS